MSTKLKKENLQRVIHVLHAVYRDGWSKADCLGVLANAQCETLNVDWEGLHLCDFNPWISSLGGIYLDCLMRMDEYSGTLEAKHTGMMTDEQLHLECRPKIWHVARGEWALISDLGYSNHGEMECEIGNVFGYGVYGENAFSNSSPSYLPLHKVIRYFHGLQYQINETQFQRECESERNWRELAR